MSMETVLAVVLPSLPILITTLALLFKFISARLPKTVQEKLAEVQHLVAIFVPAVEQVYASVPGSGAFKKAAVLKLLQAHGVSMSPDLLDAVIEAAVASLPPPASGA